MVLCKKKKSSDDGELEEEYGQTWIWTAIDAATRLLVCFFIGGRTKEDSRAFLRDLASRIDSKPLFVSDELAHYADALMEMFHDLIKPEPTGRPGRPRKAKKVAHDDLDYATVHKTREGGRIVKVEKKVVFGSDERIQRRLEESPSSTINTSYVERSNLSWRTWDAHLTRKSLTFAKSLRWLKAKFSICISFYNFVRPHGTLSKAKKITPAMAAKVTDHPWSIQELLECRVIRQ